MPSEMDKRLDKKLIEVSFPFDLVSKTASKEFLRRRGSISNIHSWWARRPLVASRSSIAAALLSVDEFNKEDLARNTDLIRRITTSSLSSPEFKKAITVLQDLIRHSIQGSAPKVLDPFAGGGSIPLEALRLGCQVHALDYNPVATLILKATLELPLRYSTGRKGLVKDLKHWGTVVWQRARKQVITYYLPEPSTRGGIDSSVSQSSVNEPLAYIWTPIIKCQNPACDQEIPLIKQFWLARKKEKKIILVPDANEQNKRVNFQVTELKEAEQLSFDPSRGTINRAIARCLSCGFIIDSKTIKKLFRKKDYHERMITVIERDKRGKHYRPPHQDELAVLDKIKMHLSNLERELAELMEIEPLPNEYLNPQDPEEDSHGTRCVKYGFTRYKDLFNPRQQVVLLTLMKIIKNIERELEMTGHEPEDRTILLTYLALLFSALTNHCSRMQRWVVNWEVAAATFSRQAIPMVWDHVELNVLHPTQGWMLLLNWMIETLDGDVLDLNATEIPIIQQGSALQLPYPDNFFDAVITDPPYDDNITYSELADFFYVWLKRLLRPIYPHLFQSPLSPKSQEIVVNPNRTGNKTKARDIFKTQLTAAFREIHRVLKPGGTTVIVYAHQSIQAWNVFVKAIADSGLVVTAAWPVKTEMTKRLRAQNSAALASTIYLIARKFPKKPPTDIKSYGKWVQQDLEHVMNKYVNKNNLNNTDMFMILLGQALHAFTIHELIYELDGSPLTTDALLSVIQRTVATTILKTIQDNKEFSQLSHRTQLYLTWRWLHGKKTIPHDEARLLSQAFGIDMQDLIHNQLVAKKGTLVHLIPLHEVIKRSKKHQEKESSDQLSLLISMMTHWKEKRQIPSLNTREIKLLESITKFMIECTKEKDPERLFLEQFSLVLRKALTFLEKKT